VQVSVDSFAKWSPLKPAIHPVLDAISQARNC
jgi:hypothetical protein